MKLSTAIFLVFRPLSLRIKIFNPLFHKRMYRGGKLDWKNSPIIQYDCEHRKMSDTASLSAIGENSMSNFYQN